MKKYLVALCFVCITVTAVAQDTDSKNVFFSFGAELAKPVGKFNDTHSFGFGVSALGEIMTSDKLGITLSAGIINYIGREITSNTKHASRTQFPILGGIRYYFVKDIYFSGQAGVSVFNRDIGSVFTYAPGVGFKFSKLDATFKIMAAAKKGCSSAGLRVAYEF